MWLENIPIPPSLNNAYPSGKHGVRYKSLELRLWERDLQMWSFQNLDKINVCRRELQGIWRGHFLAMNCVYFFEKSRILTQRGTAKRLDVDNRLKALIDGVTKLLFVDDSLIWQGSFCKRVATAGESCSVQILIIEDEAVPDKTKPMATP